MNKENYAKKLDAYIKENIESGSNKKILLHVCCAPCSSYCLEYLRQYFDVTVFFFNPNITNEEEYQKRASEEKRLIDAYNKQVESGNFEGMNSDERARKIDFIEGEYEPSKWLSFIKGYENCKEGGDRCKKCFEMRLMESARVAKENGFDGFTTSLTISPLKNADVLNDIGKMAADKYGTFFVPSDFKKKNGYKRSIELSKMYDLYRQDYCGCSFSKAQRELEKKLKEENNANDIKI